MSPASLCALVLVAALVAYGVLGGADFGGGVWDALASGPRKQAQRDAIAKAMGPVWEANHVWLIFVVVVLFTAFPEAWSAVSIALVVPLRVALVGIVLRGAAFAFRGHGGDPAAWGRVFGLASVVTPAALGAALGSVASGRMRVAHGVPTGGVAWASPLSLAMALAAVSLVAYVAAVFLAAETRGELREDFRRRALASGTVVVAGAAVTLPALAREAPHLYAGLTRGLAAPIVALGVGAALVSGASLLAGKHALARAATAVQVSAILAGFAAAQAPYLVYPDLTLEAAAAPDATLRFVLAALPFGLALLLPSLWLLFRVFKRGEPVAPRAAP